MTTSSPVVASEPVSSDVRERIVAAALRLFSEKGYAATSLREIAEAARTTKPMIYYYFKSKEGLYASTLGDLLQGFADAIDRATHEGDSPVERIRAFADVYLHYFQQREAHIAFMVREVFGLGADIMHEFGRNLEQRIRSRLRRIVEEGVQQGVFRPCDVDTSSIAMMGILNMFILCRVFGDLPLNREAAVGQLMDFYVRGLLRDG
jgi:AcrR family transcriptional regulator